MTYQTTDAQNAMKYDNAIPVSSSLLDNDERTAKLGEKIERGMHDSAEFFARLEANMPRDFIVGTRSLGFDIVDGRIYLETADNRFRLHNNAVQQMVSRTGILTKTVANKMIAAATGGDSWGRQLLLDNLHTIFEKSPSSRVLVRAVPVGGELGNELEVRGFLSDKYRRLNSGPIFNSFAAAAMEFGAVPISMSATGFRSSYATDVKVGFSMFLPYVFKPIARMRDEVIIIGLMIENSDFGRGAESVALVAFRIWCSNLMVTQDELRRVHLGTRLSDDLQFSQATYESDTQTMALAVGDVVKNLFKPDYINAYNGKIAAAAETEVEPARLFAELRSRGLVTKDEEKAIIETYNEPDVELMPAGNNAWRASNAVSLFANRIAGDDKDRAIELQHAAGTIVDRIAS